MASVMVFYRLNSDKTSEVEAYQHDFKTLTGQELNLVDADSETGAEKAALYGLVQYPSVIVVSSDGQLINMWTELPLMSELEFYLYK